MLLDVAIKNVGFMHFILKVFVEGKKRRKKASPSLGLTEMDKDGRKELIGRQISWKYK